MSLNYKQFDLFGKMINNKNFYIFNNISGEDKIEIVSRLEKFETGSEFFKYYTNKDIYNMFELVEKLNLFYSNANYEKNFESKIDIYISFLSNIYLISNLILKNRLILKKAINDVKKSLDSFYSESQTAKNIQQKINNYIFSLLGSKAKKNKKRNSLLLCNENGLIKKNKIKSESNFYIFNKKSNSTEIKIIDHSINNSFLNQDKTHDITNNTNNYYNNYNFNNEEENIIFGLTTPQFPSKNLEDDINNIDINKNMNKQESINSRFIENGDDSNKNFSKKESIHSYYTLGSASNKKKGSIVGQEKEKIASKFSKKEEKVNKEYSKFKECVTEQKSNNNVDYSIEKNKKNKMTISMKLNNQKLQHYQTSEDNSYNRKEEEEIKKTKRKTFSSTNLKSSQEKIMLKNLLVFINEIFKKRIIDSEQKLKIKQLIISKSKKLDYIYIKFYDVNKEKFIKELKNLIS
jgi:hypothetical protein